MSDTLRTSTRPPEKRRFVLFVLFGALAAFVVAVLLINFVLMPWHIRVGKEVVVPDVVGMTQDSAVKVLKTRGLALGDVRYVADTLATVGKIVETRPRSGSRTKSGRPVGLDISAGQEKTQVPMVFKLPVKRAQAAIENAGLQGRADVSAVFRREFRKDRSSRPTRAPDSRCRRAPRST